MPVQFPGTVRFRVGLRVEVHDGNYPHVGLRDQRARVVRVLPGVEEDHVPRMRSDNRTVPLHRCDIGRVRVVRDNEFTASGVICAEKDSCQRIRVDVAFESHRRAPLNVQHDAVAVVLGCRHWLRARLTGHLEELLAIGTVEPGQAVAHLSGMYPAAGDPLNLSRLPRQDRGARELMEIGVGSYLLNVLLPACGKTFVQVERGPAES
jgi:hypothetical protein